MENKYKLTEESVVFLGEVKLYRIEALKDFDNVKKGDKGGYIESEKNLSQEGDCWIYDNAKVFDNAQVYDNAEIGDDVIICDNAEVFGNAQVYENALVYDNTKVSGNA